MLYLFENKTNVANNTLIVSNEYVVPVSGSFSVSNGQVFVNGINHGTATSVAVGDTVVVGVMSSAADAVATHCIYTYNGKQGSFSVATTKGDNFPFEFDIVDANTVPANALVECESITLYRLYQAVEVSVPPICNAVVVKNGVASGTSVVCFNDDTVSLRFTSPTYGESIRIPMYIGHYFDEFISKSADLDVHPTPFSFVSKTGCLVSSIISSDVVTITGLTDTAPVSCTNATLYINGVAKGTTSTVTNGDTLAVRITTPATNETATHSVITVGDYQTSFTAITVSGGTSLTLKASYFTKNHLEDVFTPVNSSKVVVNGEKFVLGVPNNIPFTGEALHITSPYEDCMYVYADSLRFKVSFPANSRPVCVCNSPVKSNTPQVAKKFVALYGTNQVSVVDANTYSVLQYINVAANPIAITSTDDGTVYVACDCGRVSIINSQLAVTTIDVGSKLTSITTDGTAVYTTDLVGNRVYKIVGSAVTTYFTVYDGPIAIVYGAGLLYVAQYQSSKVAVVNATTLTYQSSYAVSAAPMWLSYSKGRLLVGSFTVPDVFQIQSGVVTKVMSNIACNYGVVTDGTNNYVFETAYNTPERCSLPDPAIVVGFTELVDGVSLDTQYSSPQYVVSASVAAPLSYAPIDGASVLVNGVAGTTSVSDGDVVSVVYKSSKYWYEESSLTIAIGNSAQTHRIRTRPNLSPDIVYFRSAYNVYTDAVIKTEEVLISGITPGFTATVSYAQGTIIVNGVEVGAEASVSNGDRVALQTLVTQPYGTTNVYHLMCDGVQLGRYKIATVLLEGAVKRESDTQSAGVNQYVADTRLVTDVDTPTATLNNGLYSSADAVTATIGYTLVGDSPLPTAIPTTALTGIADKATADIQQFVYSSFDRGLFDKQEAVYSIIDTPDVLVAPHVYSDVQRLGFNKSEVCTSSEKDVAFVDNTWVQHHQFARPFYVDGGSYYTFDRQGIVFTYSNNSEFYRQAFHTSVDVAVFESQALLFTFSTAASKQDYEYATVDNTSNFVINPVKNEQPKYHIIYKSFIKYGFGTFVSSIMEYQVAPKTKYLVDTAFMRNGCNKTTATLYPFVRNNNTVWDNTDLAPTPHSKHIFDSKEEAMLAAESEGFVDAIAYPFYGGWMWKHLTNSNITCDTTVDISLPVKGWIHGG